MPYKERSVLALWIIPWVPPTVRILPPSCTQIARMVSAIGFTTREFADLIGVEEYMVRFWIEGERMPNSRESRKLWEAYRRFSEAQKKKVHLLSHVGRMTPEKEKYQ